MSQSKYWNSKRIIVTSVKDQRHRPVQPSLRRKLREATFRLGELACCWCCKAGHFYCLMCAQHECERSSRTFCGTTSHKHYSKSRTHQMHSFLYGHYTVSPSSPHSSSSSSLGGAFGCVLLGLGFWCLMLHQHHKQEWRKHNQNEKDEAPDLRDNDNTNSFIIGIYNFEHVLSINICWPSNSIKQIMANICNYINIIMWTKQKQWTCWIH